MQSIQLNNQTFQEFMRRWRQGKKSVPYPRLQRLFHIHRNSHSPTRVCQILYLNTLLSKTILYLLSWRLMKPANLSCWNRYNLSQWLLQRRKERWRMAPLWRCGAGRQTALTANLCSPGCLFRLLRQSIQPTDRGGGIVSLHV